MSSDRGSRKRRSSSIVYHEPPESIEQLSDQSALPNLNAEWVNAKGTAATHDRHSTGIGRRSSAVENELVTRKRNLRLPSLIFTNSTHLCFLTSQSPANRYLYRRLAHSPDSHILPQNRIRYRPRHITGDIMDFNKPHIYGCLVPHVPLGTRHPI